MNKLAVKLQHAALALENDSGFYNSYLQANPFCYRRRLCIGKYLALNRISIFGDEQAFTEQLRRYLDERWEMPPAAGLTHQGFLSDGPTIEFWKDEVCYPDAYKKPEQSKQEIDDHIKTAVVHFENISTTLKEIFMSTTQIIDIKTKTFINGVDIASLEDSAIYSLIAAQEAEIEKLDQIGNKPKKLKAELEKRKAGIQALVDYLDSKEPA